MANAANLINFGGSALSVGDWTYSAYGLTAPSYLPLNSETNSYLVSSYPTLGAQFTTPAVTYAATARTLPASLSITNIAYGNGVIVAITGSATAQITTSLDGITWTKPFSFAGASQFTPRSMCFGAGKFVIVGENTSPSATYAFSSTDGINWTRSTINASFGINVVIAYGSGIFMTIGAGTNDYYFSTDAISWGTATGISGVTFADITYANGVFVAVSSTVDGTGAYYNISGSSWVQSSIGGAGDRFKSVAFGNGVFVTVGGAVSSTNTTRAYTSTNGISWTVRTLPASLPWRSVTFGNGSFLAVAYGTGGATGTTAATSPDGITWTIRALPTAAFWNCVKYVGQANNGFFVATSLSTAAATIDYSVTQTTFTLPVAASLRGATPYIKAS